MKTPERWCALPRHALFVSILGQKSSKDVKTSCCDVMRLYHDIMWRHTVTSWRRTVTSCDVMTSCRDVTSCVMTNWLCVIHPAETSEITFFSAWRPWPLTYDLDLQTHLRYYQGQCLNQILGLYVKWFSRESAQRHTDGTDFIPSTADVGGINCIMPFRLLEQVFTMTWIRRCLTSIWWPAWNNRKKPQFIFQIFLFPMYAWLILPF